MRGMRPIRFRLPRRPQPYTTFAVLYDLLSLEWPVYRSGRITAIEALELQCGARVLDLGCGTGLNLRHLQRRIGPAGRIVALDASSSMLRQAARRARRHGWDNVTFICADAATVDCRAWAPVDAAIATYALSVVPNRAAAWRVMRQATRPGGRIAVVDMQDPEGRWRVLRPIARWLCAVSRADIDARPWRLLEAELGDLRRAARRGQHIQVRVGTVPPPPAAEHGRQGMPG